jgi:hypothetical protein
MPIGNWNLQWLNHNSQRSYPLTERATKADTSASIRLPDSFLVAMHFPVHVGLDVLPDKFYLRSILLTPTGYNITIGYDDGDDGYDVAATNIVRSSHVPNRTYALVGLDSFADCVGHVTVGPLDEISQLPAGFYEFTPDAGGLESDVIRPMIRGISSLRVRNGTEYTERLYGHITLVAGTNMRLTVANNTVEPTITFSAISGENLNENCVCDVPDSGECIRCINGVCSCDGTFTFDSGSCTQISPDICGLSFTNTCAEPCCGCEELNALKTQMDRFADGVNTLQNFITRLGSEVTQMSMTVLGSKLGDSGCDTCT